MLQVEETAGAKVLRQEWGSYARVREGPAQPEPGELGAAWRERENETNIQREAELRYEEQILVSLQFLAKAPFHITQLNRCPWVV